MTLKEQFEKLIHLPWDEFVVLEHDKSKSVEDGVLVALIRLCTDTDEIAAAKLSFDRIDEVLETPIKINVPKFYIRYVNAKKIDLSDKKAIEASKNDKSEKASDYDPATARLRETLREMRQMPQNVIGAILKVKKTVDSGKMVHIDNGRMPQVKHVMVANLLKNVRKGRFRAIELVFDQIDGKLTRTITLLGGEDVYINDYNTLTAPANAIKDEDGYYVAENSTMTTAWLRGFSRSQKGLEMLAEGLEDD